MTGHIPRPEILTEPQRRRRWSPAEKLAMVEATYDPGVTVSLVARRNGIQPNQLFAWRKLAAQGGVSPTAPPRWSRAVPTRATCTPTSSASSRSSIRRPIVAGLNPFGERARADRFVFEDDRSRYVTGRTALRAVASAGAGPRAPRPAPVSGPCSRARAARPRCDRHRCR